jgi:hypothetical protein
LSDERGFRRIFGGRIPRAIKAREGQREAEKEERKTKLNDEKKREGITGGVEGAGWRQGDPAQLTACCGTQVFVDQLGR